MSIFNIVQLVGGLAFFLFSMGIMSSGLERLAGGKLEKLLRKMTSNPIKGMALGVGITAAVQSSSTVTVMLIGLVNSGIMQLEQTIPVIMGSNIGTTVTAWFLSLAGISSTNIFMQFLKPKNFSPIFALIGVLLTMTGKNQKKKDAGSILTGFGILMYGMVMMSDAMAPLAEMPSFTSILARFNNPLLGVLVGAVFTALIQSSAASVGVLQALSLTGAMTFGQVIPIVMGQNIGTCITAVLGSIGTTKNAKRVATAHVLFNVVGTVVFLSVWLLASYVFGLPLKDKAVEPANIAIIHSIFNIAATLLIAPFYKLLAKLAKLIIRDGAKNETALDEHLFAMPAFAVRRAFEVTSKMGLVAKQSVSEAISLMQSSNFTEETASKIDEYEDRLDEYEDSLGTYLLKVNKLELSDKEVKTTSLMMHAITNFERIGDHALDLRRSAQEMKDKEIAFFEETNAELNVIYAAVTDLVERTITAFQNHDLTLAKTVEPLEERVDRLSYKIKSNQIKRLQEGDGTAELGFILSDVLTAVERMGDHCSNVAAAMIESEEGDYDQHEYLQNAKEAEEFKHMYESYKEIYQI